MAASRSLNEPVVMVTLVRACAAPAGCTAIAIPRAKDGIKKPKRLVFIAFPNDLTIVERSDVK
jgi:hypothetical protein